MKHPELVKHKEAFIVSMEVLKERYKEAIEKEVSKLTLEKKRGQACLLCNPIGIEENHKNQSFDGPTNNTHKNKCINLGCPWIVITGETCDHESNQIWNLFYTSVYQTEDPDAQQQRINQLEEWIDIYKNI